MIVSDKLDPEFKGHIQILKETMKTLNPDYACITSVESSEYDSIIDFKYKVVNPKKQLSKVCDFLSTTEYNWYMKIRPEVKLLQGIDFIFNCIPEAMNARARNYSGPRSIPFGGSVGGEGIWDYLKTCYSKSDSERIELDDHLFIFDSSVAKKLVPFEYTGVIENEGTHTRYFQSKEIPLNVIGIDLLFVYDRNRGNARSGHINL